MLSNKRLVILAIILFIIVNYIAEISNPCAAWADTPCEYAGYNYG